MRVTVLPDPSAVAEAATRLIADAVTAGLSDLALAGGSTPRATYQRLAGEDLDWSATTLWLGDERWVPGDHPDANARMARESFVVAVRATLLTVDYGLGDPVLAARAYDRALVGAIPTARPGMVLLGMGDDGHTASLFPGSAALRSRRAGYVATWVPGKGEWRLTATLPLLWQARRIVFLVTGSTKAAMLAAVQRGDPLPAQLVAGGAADVTWLVDEAAAARLSSR